jgi:omega-hydroxy-beta-dihydromenaquinone-9 sulfotransferase
MFNISLFLNLLSNTFSLDRGSPRYPAAKRLLFAFVFLPLFLLNLLVNSLFLFLDNLFFPGFRKQAIKKPVFIIGVPRSATTRLFDLLFEDKKHFHAFTLWELVLAPSVCQKYFFLMLRYLDKMVGSPLFRLMKAVDRILFGKFVHIHDIGLCKPEEDEVLFMYNLSSLFFFYGWPGLPILDKLFYHDMRLPMHVKQRNIHFYFRCIQRHVYVFDRNNQRYFLSKNPTFIPRMASVADRFPSARFIYPIRSPYKTIPSTISLNLHIMSRFCKLPESYPYAAETRDFILNWYIMADQAFASMPADRYIKVGFDSISLQPEALMVRLYAFLGIDIARRQAASHPTKKETTPYKSKHIYPDDLGIDKNLIRARLKDVDLPGIHL